MLCRCKVRIWLISRFLVGTARVSTMTGLPRLVYTSDTQLIRAPILVGGGSVFNGAYPVKFLPLGRDGVTIASLPSKEN